MEICGDIGMVQYHCAFFLIMISFFVMTGVGTGRAPSCTDAAAAGMRRGRFEGGMYSVDDTG